MLLSFTLMSFDQVIGLGAVRTIVQPVVEPISLGLYTIGFTVHDAISFVVELPYVHSKNMALQNENDSMRAQLVSQSDLIAENRVLRDQLSVQGVRVSQRILAQSVGALHQGNDIVLILDKGSRDNVTVGLVVLVGDQLIGRITHVSESQSYVLPLVSVNSRVPSYVQQGEAIAVNGLSIGRFNNRIALTEVLQEEGIQKGDVVITSGEGGTYPRGLIIGVIESVNSTDTELFKSASLSTSWDLQTVRSVFIITP